MPAGTKVSIKDKPERRSFEEINYDPENDELWPLEKVKKVYGGCGTSNIYRLMDKGEFPKPIRLGDRTVRWLRSEVLAHINKRLAERA